MNQQQAKEIIERFESHRKSVVEPAYSRCKELGVGIWKTSLSQTTPETEAAEAALEAATAESNAMFDEYEQAKAIVKQSELIESLRNGRKMISRYDGKSALTGRRFPAGTEIYYARKQSAPCEEIDSM